MPYPFGPPVDIFRHLDPKTFKPLPGYEEDPEPCTPAPPRGGESHEDYNRRCGPFVEINGKMYQERWVEWRMRQQARITKARAENPPPKATYTLPPTHIDVIGVLILVAAFAFVAGSWWLAVFGH